MDTTLVVVDRSRWGRASVIVWRMLRDERGAPRRASRCWPHWRRPTPAGQASELPLRHAGDRSRMFTEPEQVSPRGQRFAVMAALAMVAASVILFALAAQRYRTSARAAAPAAEVKSTAPAGLELLSLRARQDGRPDDHRPRTQSAQWESAVAGHRDGLLVRRQGNVSRERPRAARRHGLRTGRRVPVRRSPFPSRATVARYRIGFRAEDGRIIGHIDRRQSGADRAEGRS